MTYRLRLYITGRTASSQRAIDNLHAICESDLSGEYEIEIIDVLEHPRLAENEKILATPTRRYVELHGEMRRGLTVLKMPGTWHEKDIREYVIDGSGMTIRGPFRGAHGILTGSPIYNYSAERERLDDMCGNGAEVEP